jgi:hypothetical protein
MNDTGKLKIHGTSPSDLRISIDGQLVPNLTAFTLRGDGPGNLMKLTLEMDVWDVEIDAPVSITVSKVV